MTLPLILSTISALLALVSLYAWHRCSRLYREEKASWVKTLPDLVPGCSAPFKNRYGTHIDMVLLEVDHGAYGVVTATMQDRGTWARDRRGEVL